MARILIVEDNPANLKLATLLLGRAGHIVLPAVDAEAGLAVAAAETPDLILMDIQLPGMDGLTATSVLKASPATSAIPVIALTAMAMKSDEEKSRLAGCDGYITKPLRYQELYATIDALLSRGDAGLSSAEFVAARDPELAAGRRVPAGGLSAPAPAALDIRVLQNAVGLDPYVILDFLDIFQTSTAAIALALTCACDERDAARAGAQAHKLMSSARAVGAIGLGALCSLMEAAGRANHIDRVIAFIPRFEREIDAVNAAILAIQDSWGPSLGRVGHAPMGGRSRFVGTNE
ncbi:response regulator [Cryobacterium sp. CG_9.6]|uniref:response regulator n=1 Tax=Cryobacterium sp. CG_9.6 TaxID=2760710 RepID=UPI0024746049|nr:response regulator [Cryobacterium sp. CG_9.6]MDH6237551.1 CheY-like chemotaxis protein [Cryobacterium sp. CG_9.6]